MSQAKSSIVIKCHGEFYAREGQLKLTKPFEEVVRAPSLKFFEQTFEKYTGTDDEGKLTFRTSTSINVRGQLKKKLLPMILANKYPGIFVRVRGVVIDSVLGENNEVLDLPVNLMSIDQLAERARQKNIPLDPSSYISVDELRTDIMEYEQDPVNFQRTYKNKMTKRAEEREFRELNNLMPKTEAMATKAKTPRGIGATAIQTPVLETQSPF